MSGLEGAAGVAGLLSLSIQVCSGLVKYYQAWQSFDEIKGIIARLNRLKELIAEVERAATEAQSRISKTSDLIDRFATSLKQGINRLEVCLENCQKDASKTGMTAAFDHSIHRLSYPFKTSRISELQRAIDTFNHDLLQALEPLKLSLISSLHEVAHGTHTKVESVDQKIETADQKLDAIGQKVETTYQDLEIVKRMLSQIVIQPNHPASMHDQARHVATQLIQQPGALSKVCDAVNSRHIDITFQHNHVLRQPKIPSAICQCHRVQQRVLKSRFLGPAEFYYREHELEKHSRSCQYHSFNEKKEVFGSRVSLHPFFNAVVDIFFSRSTGAGGMSIGVALNPVRLLRRASPVFHIISDLYKGKRQVKEIDHAIVGIKNAFQNGLASPYDEISLKSFEDMFNPWFENLSDEDLSVEGSINALTAFLLAIIGDNQPVEFLKVVLELLNANVPLDSFVELVGAGSRVIWTTLNLTMIFLAETDTLEEMSPESLQLQHVLRRHVFSVSCQDLYVQACVAMGVDLSGWNRVSRRFLDDLDVPEFLKAVLKKDLHGLNRELSFVSTRWLQEELLEQCCSRHLPEANVLVLAHDWPEGLESLLHFLMEYGDECFNDRLKPPIELACGLNNPSSLSMLLAWDHSWTFVENEKLLSSHWFPRDYARSSHDFTIDADEIFHANYPTYKVAVTAVAQRRRRLFSFAEENLTPSEWRRLGLSNVNLDGDTLSTVLMALSTANIDVPAVFKTLFNRSGTLYHHCWHVQGARIIWDHGFRDLSTVNERGDSALASVYKSSVMAWLMQQGAVYRSDNVLGGWSVNHAIGYVLGTSFLFLQEALLSFWKFEDSQSDYDYCTCPCSTHGCTPFLVYLKSSSSSSRWSWAPASIANEARKLPLSNANSISIIRLATFELLSLSHRCCERWEKPWESQPRRNSDCTEEDVGADQKATVQQLESLLDDFIHEYNQGKQRLVQFMRLYWGPRMIHIREDILKKATHTANGLQELGVELVERPELASKDSTDLDKFDDCLRAWLGRKVANRIIADAESVYEAKSSRASFEADGDDEILPENEVWHDC